MNERRDNIEDRAADTMIPLDEVGDQAAVARPPTPPRRRGGSPSRLLESNLAETTSEGHGGGRGILKKNREESNSPRIISKIDEERRKGEKFRNKSFSEEQEREGKVMNGKLKSPQRCGTDCRSLPPSDTLLPFPSVRLSGCCSTRKSYSSLQS